MSGTDPHDAQQYVTCPLHRGKAATRFETSAFRRNDSRTLQSACEMLEVAKKETIIFKEMCVQCVRWQDKQGNTYQQILAALTAEFQHCKAVGAQSRKVVHQHLCCCPSQTSYNLTVQARKKEIGKNRNFEEKKTRKKGLVWRNTRWANQRYVQRQPWSPVSKMRWRNGLVRDIGNLVQPYSTFQREGKKRKKKNKTKHFWLAK